jgi:hypothetical protein
VVPDSTRRVMPPDRFNPWPLAWTGSGATGLAMPAIVSASPAGVYGLGRHAARQGVVEEPGAGLSEPMRLFKHE